MIHLLLVMTGGALGAASRYGVSFLLPKTGWTTTTVNIVGSFVAVWIFTQLSKTGNSTHLFAITGFFGAFTTYSAFSIDTMQLLHNHKSSMSSICAFVLLNVLGSLSAAFLAWKFFAKASI